MIAFEIDLIGDAEVLRGLDEMERGFANFRRPLQDAAEIVAVSIGNNIVQGGAPEPFAPLAPSTLFYSAGRLGGPLYRTGELLDAVTSTEDARGSGFKLTREEVLVGLDPDTEVGKIGSILSAGSDENNLPARPFVRVTDRDIDMIQEAFGDYLDDIVAEAFR